MARRRKQATPAAGVTTPMNSIMQSNNPLTFGSFLPAGFQPICEESELIENEELNRNQWNSNNVSTVHAAQKGKEQLPTSPKRLQFSEVGSSKQTSDPDLRNAAMEKESTMHVEEIRKQNRSSQMGMKLDYVPPSHREGKVVIQIEEEDVNELKEYWDNALTGYVLGDTPYEKSMVSYVESVWDFLDKPQILYHRDGYYVFRFVDMKDKEVVIQAGPYTYYNKPLILQNWEIDFHIDPKCITTIPLWI
ncbi:hypothetical protein A4A49_01996 [Nicotiana attenuata]|uniref:DUF4283 domain-containing protein n=1 Tax=Nicotiana attenuata TaxID=49451 RepID=A0A314L5T8_NICAT|nr:hypothetical protein A4A49_01996 [Nicotiana attenuata]